MAHLRNVPVRFLRDDFNEESDVDVLISYEGDHYLDRADRLAAQKELSALLGRKVDWVNRLSLSDKWAPSWSPKPLREEILKTAQAIYGNGVNYTPSLRF